MSYEDLDRPPLDERALEHALVRPGSWVRSVHVSGETGSTNADLAVLAANGAPEGTVVTTDHQRAGRGRMGRQWSSPPRSGIAVSILVRPDVPAFRWPWLPLLTGVAVAESVGQATGLEASLKWPNDVLVGAGKVAGVLVERVETDTGPAATVGIGVNVSLTRAELPVPTATSLVLEGADVDRTVLLRTLVRTYEQLYRAWLAVEGDPAAGLHESYAKRLGTLGQRVRAELPDGSVLEGEAVAVDADGRLVVQSADGRRSVGAGDVLHVHGGS